MGMRLVGQHLNDAAVRHLATAALMNHTREFGL